MIRRQAGFSLVELMITMVVFVFFIVAASQVFTGLLTQFKQQSKLAETNIEGIVGLEILRQDIEHAGYGLPWYVTGANWSDLTNYIEAESISCTPNTNDFDDAPNNAPKAILSRNNASFSGCGANSIFNGSDYLVIKAVNVGRNDACNKWTPLKAAPFTSPFNPRKWTPALTPPQGEDLASTDRVIVLRPGSTDANGRTLVVNGANFYTTFSSVTSSPWPPADTSETRIVYGVDPDTDLRMPFNRADYYIWRNSTSTATDEVPDRCAPNTGVLRKAVISQNDGLRQNPLPLLDCVADMQVIFGLDTNNNGIIGTYTDGDGTTFIPWPVGTPDESVTSITAFADAASLRQQVREVRVYILAHEGQRDVNYTYPTNPITVGEFGLGRSFNFVTAGITNWQNYRWKIYTIVVKPTNLLR